MRRQSPILLGAIAALVALLAVREVRLVGYLMYGHVQPQAAQPADAVAVLPRVDAPRNGNDYGLVFNGSLFLIGARLTIEPDAVYFDVLAQPRARLVEWNKRTRKESCALHAIGASCDNLLPWEDAVGLLQSCAAQHSRDAPFVHVPIKSTDGNRVDIMLIWRCRLRRGGFVPGTEFTALRILARTGETLTLHIPTHSMSAGQFGPTNVSPTPVWKRRFNVTLCVGGVQGNGIYLLREHVRHHLAVGVDHVVLGLNFAPDSEDHARVLDMFAAQIANGTVAFINVHRQLRVLNHEAVLQYFHTACLYHAKMVSEFVGAWDIDEWWFPRPNATRPDELHGSLSRALQRVRHLDFCFLTFPSYVMHGHDNDWGGDRSKRLDGGNPLNRTGRVLFDFRWRDSEVNFVYRKSVARSRNAFLATSHVFGSCRSSNASSSSSSLALAVVPPIVRPTVMISPDDDCWKPHCGITYFQHGTGGVMRHFYPLFHSDLEHWKVRARM